MKRTFTYPIHHEMAGMTIQSFLKQQQYSSQVITHLKRTPDGICRNGVWARVHEVLQSGDLLTISIVEETSSEHIVPVPLPFPIVYEDEDLLVINKPSGMPIHPSQGNYENTLANAAAYYFTSQNIPFTYRCINRLDRDTTGLLIIAKHMYSASLLSNMVARREIHREYLAAATGLVEESGMIEAPIGRANGSTIERCVDFAHGDYACTHFHRLAYQNGYSLVSLKLETGRTHQIRVHMKYIGHPLPGDFLYHPEDHCIDRQALHSYRLSFIHPITKQSLTFTAPLPEDMQAIFQKATT